MRETLKNFGLMAGLTVGLVAGAYAAVAPDFNDKLQSDDRPMEDRMRDDARRPHQVMELLGVEEGMTAVDFGAGGGWYTRVLSAAVGQDGTVISQFGPRALERNDGQDQKDMSEGLGNVEPSFDTIGDMESGVADVAVNALNTHHSNHEQAVATMEAMYAVLKPGGRLALIDHEGSEGMDNQDLHRMLASDARSWLEEAGFEIEEVSDMLHTNADDHSAPPFAPQLGRNTDRFLIIARKPE